METTTTKNTAGTTPHNLKRQKITSEIIKFSDFDSGHTVNGVYKGAGERPWVDKKTGQEKIIPLFFFENPTDGSRFMVFGDAGLVNAMTSANVKEGMHIEIEKLDQVELGGGQRVNQYEIYALNN